MVYEVFRCLIDDDGEFSGDCECAGVSISAGGEDDDEIKARLVEAGLVPSDKRVVMSGDPAVSMIVSLPHDVPFLELRNIEACKAETC
jgi:hypothetical protein